MFSLRERVVSLAQLLFAFVARASSSTDEPAIIHRASENPRPPSYLHHSLIELAYLSINLSLSLPQASYRYLTSHHRSRSSSSPLSAILSPSVDTAPTVAEHVQAHLSELSRYTLS